MPCKEESFRKEEPVSLLEYLKSDYLRGIGKFMGLKQITTNNKREEFILLEYKDGDRLYLPIEETIFIQKYIGRERPTLSKLGGKSWQKTNKRV